MVIFFFFFFLLFFFFLMPYILDGTVSSVMKGRASKIKVFSSF